MQDQDFDYFLQNMESLYQTHGYKFVAIKNQNILGFYDTFDEALENTIKTEEPGSFLIQECLENREKMVHHFQGNVMPVLAWGCGLGDKKSGHGLSFTATFNGIVQSLNTPVKVESTINSNDKLEIRALWDTGASCSLIRPEVAAKLTLKVFSKTLMSTPSDKGFPTNVYLINIYLPNGAKIVNIRALEGTPNSCDMLIGMDVISLGDFAVTNNNGHTMFSFRIPSMTEIDFCKHSYIMPMKNENKKVGRNDPCPCGSGKKYKTCCGK